MIIICEPLCKGHSHEKFNGGFIHGLHLAYPEEKIFFYADSGHVQAVEYIIKSNNITVENIEYIPIKFRLTESLAALIQYYFLFNRILADAIAGGSNKVFLVSFNAAILYILKKLKRKQEFQHIKFTLVCHGEFEYIADDCREKEQLQPVAGKSLFEKLKQAKATDIMQKINNVVTRHYCSMVYYWRGVFREVFKLRFSLKKIMLWQLSSDFKYILLGPHILTNAKKYIDVKGLDFYTVILPTPFSDKLICTNNKHVKFAVFGYGYSAMIHKVLANLSRKQLKNPYEIRLIGGNNRGTEGYPNITSPNSGKLLSRAEMEKYVPDIDVFLILYDRSLYRLSCSGTIMEALSYIKPILHFENDCINAFNKKENPIGICCDSVDSMAIAMEDIINNYSQYIPKFKEYRDNILMVRKQVSIGNNLQQLRDSFTW